MKILNENYIGCRFTFDFEFSYEILDFCRRLKEKVGYKNFFFYNGKWRFNDIIIAKLIKERYPEIEVDEKIKFYLDNLEVADKKEVEKRNVINEIKKKTDSDIQIRGLKKNLYGYQKVGVEFLEATDGKAIIADQMGAGKSAQALAYCLYKDFKKVLVICPSSVKYVWEIETKKWTNYKPFLFDGKVSKSNLMSVMDEIGQSNIIIINYDLLFKYNALLSNLRFDCCIMDEFHYIKNNAAKRTKVAKLISRNIKSIILLSGTPLLNRPVEMFNGLNLIDPRKWNNWMEFTIKYCGGRQGYFGWEAKGATNIEELKSKISHYFIRRLKSDVLKDLPQKQYLHVPIEIGKKERKEYNEVLNDFKKYLKKHKKQDRELQTEKLVQLGALRMMTSNAKIDTAEELIQNIIDGGEKVIVFSCYNNPIEELHKRFAENSVILTGKSDEKDRREAIDKFQNDENINIFFGGIKSAGVGITLTAASSVVFLDFSWVPADHRQAEDRCHRPGTTADSIKIFQLYAINTIDEYMKNILDRKQEIFNKLMDDHSNEEIDSNLLDDLIDEIKNT